MGWDGWMGVARDGSQWHSRAHSHVPGIVDAVVWVVVVVCGVGQRGLMLRYAGQDAFLL